MYVEARGVQSKQWRRVLSSSWIVCVMDVRGVILPIWRTASHCTHILRREQYGLEFVTQAKIFRRVLTLRNRLFKVTKRVI